MTSSAERRRSPRVELMGRVKGDLVPVDVPLHVREISLGGMSIQTSTPFSVNERRTFQLTLGDGSSVVVVGRVVYSRNAVAGDTSAYVTGVQFLDEDARHGQTDVEDLIGRLT